MNQVVVSLRWLDNKAFLAFTQPVYNRAVYIQSCI